jgi:superoxide dismutase, Cu-Zn family
VSATTRRSVIPVAVAVSATLMIGLIATQQPAEGEPKESKRAINVKLYNAEGDRVGRAKLKPSGEGETRVQARIADAAPGFHGFHIHAVGLCEPDAPDGPFTTAGGHLAEGGQSHGAHVGDMPSLLVLEDGTAALEFVTDRFEPADLRDADGSAVMIHAGRDNFANIPTRYVSTVSGQPGPDADTLATGDAGARYACGVIEAD